MPVYRRGIESCPTVRAGRIPHPIHRHHGRVRRSVGAMLVQTVDSVLRRTSISGIDWYRRAVSPHKGFACAHRVKYGGDSCSQFARRVFETSHWRPGVRALLVRFQMCEEAARALRRDAASDPISPVHDGPPDVGPERPNDADYVDVTDLACNCLDATGERFLNDGAHCCLQGCLDGCISATIGSMLTIFFRS